MVVSNDPITCRCDCMRLYRQLIFPILHCLPIHVHFPVFRILLLRHSISESNGLLLVSTGGSTKRQGVEDEGWTWRKAQIGSTCINPCVGQTGILRCFNKHDAGLPGLLHDRGYKTECKHVPHVCSFTAENEAEPKR